MVLNETPSETRRMNTLLGICLFIALLCLTLAMSIALFKWSPHREQCDIKPPITQSIQLQNTRQ